MVFTRCLYFTLAYHSELNSYEPLTKLVYVTPEMLNQSHKFQGLLRRLHERKKLARIVVDEAHCVSQWGHDFRPDYKVYPFVCGVSKLAGTWKYPIDRSGYPCYGSDRYRKQQSHQ